MRSFPDGFRGGKVLGVRRPWQAVVLGMSLRALLFPRLPEEGPGQASGESHGRKQSSGKERTVMSKEHVVSSKITRLSFRL